MTEISYKLVGIIIIGCILFSLLFTILPLLGWSYYSLESSLIQCGVEWAERSWNVQSYNFVIFITNFFIPVGVVTYCIIYTLKIVKEIPIGDKEDDDLVKKLKIERKLTITMLTYIASFVIAWTPYTITSLMSAVYGQNAVSPIGSLIPALFAKSSMTWAALFFIFSNKKFKQTIFGSSDRIKN